MPDSSMALSGAPNRGPCRGALDLDDPQTRVAIGLLAAGLARTPEEQDAFVAVAIDAAGRLTLLQIEEAVDAVRLALIVAGPLG
jgi:hypothetical protein